MRFFHQAARRAAVLLLCLSMLTGMLIPAFAATTDPATETPAHNPVYTDNQDENHDPIYKVWLTDDGVSGGCGSGETEDGYVVDMIYAGATPEFRFGSEKPTEPVVLTVYERYEGESAVAAKTYTLSELKALAQTEVVGYQHWKNGSEKVIASNLYATVGSLLADAGVEFGAGDAVTAADSTDFTSTLTYEDSGVYKYYVNEDGATEVPAAILISWNTGSGTPEDIAKTAYISGSLRFAYGITEQQYTDQSAQGKRLASNVVTLTVTHPERVVLTVYEQDEGGEAKEVKSYKPSELAALATEGTAGYQFWKKGEAQLVAATQYVTMNDLLTDAGVTFSDLDTLKAAAADGFSSELTLRRQRDLSLLHHRRRQDRGPRDPRADVGLRLRHAGRGRRRREEHRQPPLLLRYQRAAVRRSVCTGQAPRLQYRHDHRRARHDGPRSRGSTRSAMSRSPTGSMTMSALQIRTVSSTAWRRTCSLRRSP